MEKIVELNVDETKAVTAGTRLGTTGGGGGLGAILRKIVIGIIEHKGPRPVPQM
jgi:hypothetical protein